MADVVKRRKAAGAPDRVEHYDGPDVPALVTEYQRAITQRDGNYWKRQQVNYETRYCLWANQSWDGRKWAKRDGKRPFPWLGASDARVPLVDKYIREDAAILMQVWAQQRILVRPTQPAKDAGWANRVTALLRWLVYEEMEETEDEAEYLANLYLERGAAALGVWWCREEQLTRETISMEALENAAGEARARLARGERGDSLEFQAAMPDWILDPAREPDVVTVIQAMLGEAATMDVPRIKRLVRDLREKGTAAFPRPIVVKDRPMVRALVLNEDLVIPPEVVDLQQSRCVFHRELVTETGLQARARSYGYDSDWVDQVIETQRGKLVMAPSDLSANRSSALGRGDEDSSQLYEIVTAYERQYDADGIPGLWTTVFSPSLRTQPQTDDGVGKHELLDYAHGKFPMTIFALERRSRLIDDSRGYGERATTWQQQIKRQWDTRTDRADVSTLPPSYHPPEEEPDAWGPGVMVPTLQSDRFGYFEIPTADQGSKEIEETVRRFADEYFGRPVDEQNTVEAGALKQELVRGWLKGWKRAHTQVLQLCQQYLPDQVWLRVVGGDQGRTLRVTREEIQGPFNVTLRFNAQDLDAEFVKEKLTLLQQALAFDVSGRLDRDEVLTAAMELIDPSYAERLIQPAEDAALQQVDDEQTVLAKLLMGIGVDVRGDEAFALRKKVLESTIQQSPTVQTLIRSNPQAADLVKRRMQQLDFNIQQKLVNPEIGRRLGSQPMSAAGGAPAASAAPVTP